MPDAIARNEAGYEDSVAPLLNPDGYVRARPARREKMVGRQKLYPAGKSLNPERVGEYESTDPLGLHK